MDYHIYLREGNDCRLVAKENSDLRPVVAPNPGDHWTVMINGREVVCEIEEFGDVRFGIDERTYQSQDVFVHRVTGA